MNDDLIKIYFYFCLLLSFKTVFREGDILSLPPGLGPSWGTVSISSRTIFRIFGLPGPCPLNARSTLPTNHCDNQSTPNTFPNDPWGGGLPQAQGLSGPLQALREELFYGPLRSPAQSLSVTGMPESMQKPELQWI